MDANIADMKIALLIERGSTLSSVATTMDMLALAKRFQPDAGWRLSLYSRSGGPIALSDRLSVDTRPLPANFDDCAAVVVPGFFAETAAQVTEELHTTWRQAILRLRDLPEGVTAAASCHGTFLLAEAGLLDGRTATTAWWFAQTFRERYPKVTPATDLTLSDCGRAITAGAMTAHTDLVLHLLRRLGGSALARNVGGIMLVDGARFSQRPFMSLPRVFADPLVQRAIDWMAGRLSQQLTVDALADRLHVSYRTLNRRFVGATGMAPLAYLQALRIERAKELLESSRTDFDAITAQVGYRDAASFRRLFKRATGLSPMQYRRRFAPCYPR
ncbi:helix-turn-helix domain-containing protein [Marinobacterium sp. D7]|uniref:GlxA family transcriptional regulator n=1 Tax=Marinobacterium ramblicola TaxID=2849041 RepID=UPI001C2D2AE1|nr:helix-turn-helix domain-containing protein [Marinobacterium ramblicola]MBV1786859.1 helix-turn-helix domain-containing protein [Marinobacterium ramblicola]